MHCTDAWLGTWEETLKSVVRECFATMTRAINGVSAYVVALLVRTPSAKVNGARERPGAWRAWWSDRAQSTFNAVIERDRTAGQAQPTPKARAAAPGLYLVSSALTL